MVVAHSHTKDEGHRSAGLKAIIVIIDYATRTVVQTSAHVNVYIG